MRSMNKSWQRASTRGVAALLAVTTILQLAPAAAAPGDIFTIPAPVIGGALPKAAELKTGDTSVSSQTGALQYRYPIAVPPGRQGAAPALSLSYSSQGALYGGPAANWSLDVPKITEDTSFGRLATHYGGTEYTQGAGATADDRFVSSMAGGRSLVVVPEPLVASDVAIAYRAQADATFTRYERMKSDQPHRWRARTTDGTVFYFGEAANAPGCPLSDGFAPLTRTSDRFGNEVIYSYVFVNRECLLSNISWGRNAAAGTTDFASVEIKTQHAPVCPGGFEVGAALDYRSGTAMWSGTNYITSFVIKAFDPGTGAVEHTRTITLGYYNAGQTPNTESCTGATSPVRLLRSIQETAVGTDAPVVNLPPVTFQYGSAIVDQAANSTITTPPWNDSLIGVRPRTNFGWGIRRQGGDDRWPTVEAMMLDVDGDGLLDRIQNAWTTNGGVTSCRASWQRAIAGPTLQYGAEQLLSWGSTSNYRMPMLRWNGAQEPGIGQPNLGSTQAAPGAPYLEGCALNGQVTYFHNSHPNNNLCHDNVTPCVSEPSGNGGSYCPVDGNACGSGASIPSPRTYLAYRWIDMDGDSLPDLVGGIHGTVDRYDVVRGNDVALNGAYEPSLFGTVSIPGGMPSCSNVAERCKALGHSSMNPGASCDGAGVCTYSWGQLNTAVAQAGDDECEFEIGQMSLAKIPTGNPASTGNATAHAAPRKPYKACAGLYPWFIFKNRGNGNFADTPEIKYQPLPLESDNGDSSLTGSVGANTHAIQDINGDGFPDGIAQARDFDSSAPIEPWWWFVWLNDRSGGLGPKRYIWPARDFGIGAVNGFNTTTATVGASMGLIDMNGDGLSDHWSTRAPGVMDVAYNSGSEFRVGTSHEVGELALAIKPGAENNISQSSPPVNGFRPDGISWAATRVADIDADGRADVITTANQVPTWVNFNNSGQFLAAVQPPTGYFGAPRFVQATNNSPTVDNEPYLWRLYGDLIDLDGDGLPESANWDGLGNLQLARHSVANGPPRLLTVIDNGRGASTAVTYASMHDTTAVTQNAALVVNNARRATPQTQWVVKALAGSDAFTAGTATTSYFYKNPVHSADDEGRFAFRGFEEVTATAPTGSRTVQRFSYFPDKTGRLTATIVMPKLGSGEGDTDARTIDTTTWDEFSLFGGVIKTHHATMTEHFVCKNAQTEAGCTPALAGGYMRTLIALTAIASTTSGNATPLLWQETDRTLMAGTATADGDRTTKETFALNADVAVYQLRPLITTKEVRVGGAPQVYAKSAQTWDASYRVPLTDELWFDGNSANRAITQHSYDMASGNVTQTISPNGDPVGFEYDPRKLFVQAENQHYTHNLEFWWEYGTGTKVRTRGPQWAWCAQVDPMTCDWTKLVRDESKIKIDGLGRTIERWESVMVDAVQGYFELRKVETNTYLDTPTIPSIPTSVTHEEAIKETSPNVMVYAQDKTELDGHGRTTKKTVFAAGSAPNDQITTFHYNADGTLHDVTLPNPMANDATTVLYEYTFDSLGRAKSIRRPDTTTLSQRSGVDMAYNGVETTTSEVVGAAGGSIAVTKTTNDGFGRLVKVEEERVLSPLSWATTLYAFDPNDNVKQITDPENKVTALAHDFASRRTSITRINGGTQKIWSYGYDKNGNMTAETTPCTPIGSCELNHTTSTAYNDFDQPISRSVAPRTMGLADRDLFGVGIETMVWDYGANGRGQLVQWIPHGPTTQPQFQWISHDPVGRKTMNWHSFNTAGFNQVQSISRTFHPGGRLNRTAFGDLVQGGTVQTVATTDYDGRGLPSTISVSTDGGFTFPTVVTQTRNVAGLVIQRSGNQPTANNFVQSNWTYDKLGRVSDQTIKKVPSNTQVAKQSLTYFGNDDPKTLQHFLGTASKTFTYAYDVRHQLTGVTTNTSSYFGAAYSYGTAGRFSVAQETRSGTAPPNSDLLTRNVNYVYGGADAEQVTALTNVSGGARFATFVYDDAGNMTSRCMGATYTPTCTGELLEYLYDGKDQLRRATRKLNNAVTGSEEYWYDSDGNRTQVRKLNAAGATTELVWFLDEKESHVNSSGTIIQAYAHVGAGTPVARVDRTHDYTTSTEYQFHGLASNTLAAVDRSTGTINASFSYAPFGEVLEATNAGGAVGVGVHKRRFNDKQQDDLSSVSALTYYGARYYDRALIGWTQGDPLYRFAPDSAWSSPRMALLYSAMLNNPLRYVDPDGRSAADGVLTTGFRLAAVAPHPVAKAALVVGTVAAAAVVAGLTMQLDFEGMVEGALAAKASSVAGASTAIASAGAAARALPRIRINLLPDAGTPSGPPPEPPSVREMLKGVGLGILKTLKLPKGSGTSMEDLLSKSLPELEAMAAKASGPARQAIQKVMKIAKQSQRITKKGGDLSVAPGPAAPQADGAKDQPVTPFGCGIECVPSF